ncbi:MAG: sulfite exporter TauE/SafE family protein, partial [Betaproteobacteria bacterium]|nr:sulfite exporter TauE/SafE family protein [Betaproteobacteria bacterium]
MLADLTLTQHILSVVSGVAVGFTLGLIGGGGSILAVPLLLYLVGYPNPHVVIGTTALAVSINAYLNLIPHARAGNVRWKEAVIFAIVGAIAAYIGSTLGKAVDGKKLLFLFAILMLVIAALMIRP